MKCTQRTVWIFKSGMVQEDNAFAFWVNWRSCLAPLWCVHTVVTLGVMQSSAALIAHSENLLKWQSVVPRNFSNCVVNSNAYFFVIKLPKINLISGHAINTKFALYFFQSYRKIYQFFSEHEMGLKVYGCLLISPQLY